MLYVFSTFFFFFAVKFDFENQQLKRAGVKVAERMCVRVGQVCLENFAVILIEV